VCKPPPFVFTKKEAIAAKVPQLETKNPENTWLTGL
jgi:hypothetical protein